MGRGSGPHRVGVRTTSGDGLGGGLDHIGQWYSISTTSTPLVLVIISITQTRVTTLTLDLIVITDLELDFNTEDTLRLIDWS